MENLLSYDKPLSFFHTMECFSERIRLGFILFQNDRFWQKILTDLSRQKFIIYLCYFNWLQLITKVNVAYN
jgi:hypothetical protein